MEKRDCIDNKLKRHRNEANKTTTIPIAEVQKTIESYNKEIEQATEEIGRLAEQYSELSLSGSFSGQIGKSVKLFETYLESVRNQLDLETVKQIEESLDRLKKKLSLVHSEAEAVRKKVYHPTMVD